MSLDAINKSVIMKMLGLSIDTDEIKIIITPNEVLAKANNKMEIYHKTMKEYKHASLKNKIRMGLKQYDSNDEVIRKKELDRVMLQTRLWMKEAAEYFKGCRRVEVLEKFSKEIEGDFSTLRKKKYLNLSLNDKYEKYVHFEKKDYQLLGQDNSNSSHFQSCQLAYDNICKRFQILLRAKIEEDNQVRESLDEVFKQKRKDAKSDLEKTGLAISKFRETKKIVSEYCAKFDDAKIKFMDYISTIDSKSSKVKDKIATVMETIETLEQKKKKALKCVVNAKLQIYFPVSSEIVNNLLQAFEGFVLGLNSLHRHLAFGSKSKDEFSKMIKKQFDILDEKLKKELPDKIAELSQAGLNNANKSVRSDQINEITEKIEKQAGLVEDAANKVDRCIIKVNSEYDEWKKSRREKRMRVGVLVGFGLLAVFTNLFAAFFPLLDAATSKELSPVDAAPQ